MSRRRSSAGDEPGEGDERPWLALLDGWCDEPTLTAQLVETLTDVGTVVNMLSLYERMEALREAAGLEPSPLPSNNARSHDIEVAFKALLKAHRSLFVVRKAPWSPKARLVDLARGAAAPRSKPSRNMRAEDAYEAQLVKYLVRWQSATLGTLGLDNPPPAGVRERVSTAAFISCRWPDVFLMEEAAAGQLSVRLASAPPGRGEARRGVRGGNAAQAAAREAIDALIEAPPAPEQAAPTPKPEWLAVQPPSVWGQAPAAAAAEEEPPQRAAWRPYAPPPDRADVVVAVPLPVPAALEMPSLLAALPPQHSILPPPPAPSRPPQAEPPRAAAPETAEARLLRLLWAANGGDRLLAHMAEQGIQASDLLHLRSLPPAEADAELQLLGFAEAVQRSRVRAALREAAADQ